MKGLLIQLTHLFLGSAIVLTIFPPSLAFGSEPRSKHSQIKRGHSRGASTISIKSTQWSRFRLLRKRRTFMSEIPRMDLIRLLALDHPYPSLQSIRTNPSMSLFLTASLLSSTLCLPQHVTPSLLALRKQPT